jgi:hypothetical protein
MKYFGWVSAIFVSLCVGTILNWWAFSLLWAWFVVPVFALPAISTGQAIGLSMFISFATYQAVDCQQSSDCAAEKFGAILSLAIIRPLLTLAIALVVRAIFF